MGGKREKNLRFIQRVEVMERDCHTGKQVNKVIRLHGVEVIQMPSAESRKAHKVAGDATP